MIWECQTLIRDLKSVNKFGLWLNTSISVCLFLSIVKGIDALGSYFRIRCVCTIRIIIFQVLRRLRRPQSA